MDGMTMLCIALFVGALVFRALTEEKAQAIKKEAANQHVVKVKQCPPHQWFYQDIVDEAGTFQGQRLVCKLCGPIRTGGSDEV